MKKYDKRREGETALEYMNRHHAMPDDPLNEGISDEEAMANGTLAKPDDPCYRNREGGIIAVGRWPGEITNSVLSRKRKGKNKK